MLRRLRATLLRWLICVVIIGIGLQVWSYSRRARYRKVDGQWAWVGHNMGVGRYEVKFDSDAKSFVILDDPKYGKDHRRVFYEGRPILDADPASFLILPTKVGYFGQCYATDKAHVFLQGYAVPGADPVSFEIIDAPYARDKTRVYCGTVPIAGSDPATFQVMKLSTCWSSAFTKDGTFEFDPDFADLEVSKDRPAITTNGSWAKDAKQHYWDAAVVKDADYETFHAVERPLGAWNLPDGRDKDHEYVMSFRKHVFERALQEREEARKEKMQRLQNQGPIDEGQ